MDLSISDKNRFAFAVLALDTKNVIGHAEIYVTGKSACLGRILIGDKLLRGKGVGQKIVASLLDYAFLDLSQDKIELYVFDWNSSAIKCYERSGFTINPDKKRERKVNGKTWIALNMTITKEEWQQKKDKVE